MRQFLKSRKFGNNDRSYFARNVKLLRHLMHSKNRLKIVFMQIKACKTKLEKKYFSKSFGVINFRTRRKKLYFRRYKLSNNSLSESLSR